MKTDLTVILLVVLLPLPSLAQIDVRKGVKAGLNFATYGGSNAPSTNSSTAQYAFGAFVEVKFLNQFSIEPEAFYSVKGTNEIITAIVLGLYDSRVTETLSYLEIPVLFKYYLPQFVPQMTVYAGPSVGFLLDARVRKEGPGPEYEMVINDQRTNTDFGLVVGSVATIPTGIVDATLDVRYYLGLTAISNNAKHQYNRVITLLLGVSI